MLIKYIKALFGSWLTSALVVAGLISTAMTFVPIYIRNFSLTKQALIGIAIAAWVVASYRVFALQQRVIESLEQNRRRALLKLKEESGSFYLRSCDLSGQVGAVVELHLSIENKGDRPSTIESYDVEVQPFETIQDVKPFTDNRVSMPNGTYMLNQDSNLIRNYVEVPSERLAGPLFLRFYLPHVISPEARSLECGLIVRDTENNQATIRIQACQRN